MQTRLFQLDARLSACAELLSGRAMADIGTDHAYLPVWAAAEGKIQKAIAADINEGPLEAARQHVEKYGLGEKITLRLSDGLKEIKPFEAEDIVMAGMGGELIARIIHDAPWLKEKSKRVILQPMSKEEVLRQYLCENGFCVEKEIAAQAGGKAYTVMQASYRGEKQQADELFLLVGRLKGETEAEKAYIEKKLRALEKKILGAQGEEKEKLGQLCAAAQALLGRT